MTKHALRQIHLAVLGQAAELDARDDADIAAARARKEARKQRAMAEIAQDMGIALDARPREFSLVDETTNGASATYLVVSEPKEAT